MCRHICSILDVRIFGEAGTNFSLQLLSQTQFAKIKNEKVLSEYQC